MRKSKGVMENIKVIDEWKNLPHRQYTEVLTGTWVPLHDGRLLAERNGVLDKLRPIFDFVHKDRDKSPPQAPKHTTAASNKPRVPKAAPVRRAPS